MAVIYEIGWDPERPFEGYDIHLVRGQVSRALLESLVIDYDLAVNDKQIVPSLSPTWTRQRAAVPLPAGLAGAFKFSTFFTLSTGKHGIDVNVNNGTITTAANPRPGIPGPVMSFMIRIELTPHPGGTGPAVPAHLHVRVHVHDQEPAAHMAVLSPNPFTLRKGGPPVRLSILAKFPDGEVGDVSRSADISITALTGPIERVMRDGTTNPSGVWIRATPAANVGDTGSLRMNVSFASQPVQTEPVDIKIAAGLTNPHQAKPVRQRSGKMTQAKIKSRTNLLFLPDGFTFQEDFDRYVDLVVQTLDQSTTYWSPFGKMAGAINYFSVWVPSPSHARGPSILGELHTDNTGTGTVGRAMPHPRPIIRTPPTPITIDSVAALLYAVGLPPTPAASLSPADWEAKWRATFEDPSGVSEFSRDIVLAPNKATVINQWQDLGNRVLLAEEDTLFGIAGGERPRFQDKDSTTYGWHPFRTSREHLDTSFLPNVTIPGSPAPISTNHWSDKAGKDRTLVTVLLAGAPGGGRNLRDDAGLAIPSPNGEFRRRNSLIAPSIAPAFIDTVPLNMPAGGAAFLATLQPYQPLANPAPIPLKVVGTIVHEIGHSIGLGDEYGTGTPPGGPGLSFPAGSAASALRNYGNLVDSATLVTAHGNHTLDEGIRWNYHRMRGAGLVRSISQSGAFFHLQMRRGDGSRLKTVFARARTRGGPAVTNLPAYLRHRPLPDFFYAPAPTSRSPLLDLRNANITGDLVKLDASTSGLAAWVQDVTPDELAQGVLLFIPSFWPSGDERRLVHPRVVQHLQAKSPAIPNLVAGMNVRRVNRASTPPSPRLPFCGPDVFNPTAIQEVEQVPTVTTAGSGFGPDLLEIVGIFTGGVSYDCGVLHPTARCIMRREIADATNLNSIVGFCPVCRYIIIDRLKPALHAEMDPHYGNYGRNQ